MRPGRRARVFAAAAVVIPAAALLGWALGRGRAAAEVAPTVICRAPGAADQDDMCIWVHPTDPARSTVIASDKAAGKLFVYDLSGKPIQSIDTAAPGNVDLRYGFALGGGKVDVVAFNQRAAGYRIAVYAVDPATRRLRRVDNGDIRTGPNYGGCLCRSRKSGKLYFITTSSAGRVEQHELSDDGNGEVVGKKVREWEIGLCEGAVADDEAGKLYIGEENKGVWEVGAEPADPAPGKLVIRVGDDGLTADVEGLAIYPLKGGEGYLIVSSQGSNDFKVYRRAGRHELLGTFTVRGARDTDGIDVTNVALGKAFPAGLFACHSNVKRAGACPVLLTRWDQIARALRPPLKSDTSRDPRKQFGGRPTRP